MTNMAEDFLGFGIGLRHTHYDEILSDGAKVDWFEAISENYMRPGGTPRRVLGQIADRFPLVLHGVALSIGSSDPLNEEYLNDLAGLVQTYNPRLVSDHLCWSGVGGQYAHDLLPLPYTEEALNHIAERVGRVQDRLGRQFLVENVSSYMAFSHSTMTEWEFLSALAHKSGCGLLFDVNNIFVSAHNHRFDAMDFINGVPVESVKQIHLAGHSSKGELLLDTHDHAVRPEVWDLYAATIKRMGAVPTLLEWDDKIPDLARVEEEAATAKKICAQALLARQGGNEKNKRNEEVAR